MTNAEADTIETRTGEPSSAIDPAGSARQRLLLATGWALYFGLAGGFAAWHGHDFLTVPHSAIIVLPPLLLAAVRGVWIAWKTRSGLMFLFHGLVYPVGAGITIGGPALLCAYGISVAVGDWKQVVLRATISALAMGLLAAVAVLAYQPRSGGQAEQER